MESYYGGETPPLLNKKRWLEAIAFCLLIFLIRLFYKFFCYLVAAYHDIEAVGRLGNAYTASPGHLETSGDQQ